MNLKIYTGEPIQVAGKCAAWPAGGELLPLIVVTGNGPSLLAAACTPRLEDDQQSYSTSRFKETSSGTLGEVQGSVPG